jgi:DNA-binding LytR/AlgR family response regulator
MVTTTRHLVAKQTTTTSLEEMLPEEKFLHIHRSFIIAAGKNRFVYTTTFVFCILLEKSCP